MRCVVYTRVSTKGQAAEGVSLDTQLEMAHKYALERGWSIVGSYTDVQTGKSSSRPEMKRLLQEAKAKRFDMVLFYKIDRMSRRARFWYEVWGVLEDAGVAFASLTQPIDVSTPQGRFMFGQYILIAEMESANIGERVAHNLRTLAARGQWVAAGSPPVGYNYQPGVPDGHGRRTPGGLVPDPEMAPVIAEAFERFAAGESLRGICDSLTARGCLTRSGHCFRVDTLTDVLKNPAYVGRIVYGRKHEVGPTRRKVLHPADKWVIYDDAHEAIVLMSTFEKVQQRFAERAALPSRTKDAMTRHAWGGLLSCAACGRNLRRQQRRDEGGEISFYAYHCSTYSVGGKSACEEYGRVTSQFLEKIAERFLCELVDRVAQAVLDEAPAQAAPRRKVTDPAKQIAALEAKKDAIKEGFVGRLFSLEEAQARTRALDEEIAALRVSQVATDAPPPMPRLDQSIVEAWPLMTPSERNEMLRAFIEKVVVGRDTFTFHFVRYHHPAWPTEPVTLKQINMRWWKGDLAELIQS